MYEDVVLTEEEKDEEYKMIISEFPDIKERDILRGYARALYALNAHHNFSIYLEEKEAWKKGASPDDLHPIFYENFCGCCGKPHFDYMSNYVTEEMYGILKCNMKLVDKYCFDIDFDYEKLEKKLDEEAEEENDNTAT